MKPTPHKLKKDKFVKARGGGSHFLNISCAKCGGFLALYQKDGPGALVRMYLDRIFEPASRVNLHLKFGDKKDVPNLICSKCENLAGVPMIYEPENRLAFRLIHGAFKRGRIEIK